MLGMWLIFILMIWFVRFFAAYDSRYLNEKYYYINKQIKPKCQVFVLQKIKPLV